MTASVSVITADGVEHNLDQLVARGVEGVTGLMRVPEKRGSNLVVPGEHGELHVVGKRTGAANVVLPMWVRGVNPDGTIPGNSDAGARLQFHQNLRGLINMFTEDELITVRHTLTDDTARQIVGEVTDAIDPTVSGYARYTLGKFIAALNCHNPFWADLTDTTDSVSLTNGATGVLDAFAGASAPMEDLLVVFGPQPNPRFEQPSTGVFVALDRVITAGQTITVNTATWEVFGTGGVAGGLYQDLSYGGRGTSRWFALRPEPRGGAPIVRLTHTGGGTGSVTVTGKRKHKIA